jgi:hypothetical protein
VPFVLLVLSDRSVIPGEGQLNLEAREIILEPIPVIMGGGSRRYEVTDATSGEVVCGAVWTAPAMAGASGPVRDVLMSAQIGVSIGPSGLPSRRGQIRSTRLFRCVIPDDP